MIYVIINREGETVITLAEENDLEDIYQLICELEQETINKEHFIRVFDNGLKNPDIYYIVYRQEEKIVGFISLTVHHYLHHHNDTGEIVELVVLPKYRNLKIGEQLIQYIEIIARDLKLEEIELSTSTYRKKAHRFYEAHGYEKKHYNYTKKLII